MRRLKGEFVDVASVSGIAGQILRGFFKGWLRNEGKHGILSCSSPAHLGPCTMVGFPAKTREFPEPDRLNRSFESLQNQTASTFEKVFQKLDSLGEELDQRGRTSAGPARKDQRAAEARAAARKQRGRTKAEARAVDPVHPNPNPKP